MPRTPLNETPFDPSFGLTRECPRCGEAKLVTPQNWTGRWVTLSNEDVYGNVTTKKVRRPTVYCRECVKRAKRENRMVHKIIDHAPDDQKQEWAATLRGPCQVCGQLARQRSVVPRYGLTWTLCSQCKSLLHAASGQPDPVGYTRSRWLDFAQHLADEKRIETEMLARTDQPYAPHQFNPDFAQVTYPHLACVSLELSWRKLYQWIRANEPGKPFAE